MISNEQRGIRPDPQFSDLDLGVEKSRAWICRCMFWFSIDDKTRIMGHAASSTAVSFGKRKKYNDYLDRNQFKTHPKVSFKFFFLNFLAFGIWLSFNIDHYDIFVILYILPIVGGIYPTLKVLVSSFIVRWVMRSRIVWFLFPLFQDHATTFTWKNKIWEFNLPRISP